MEINEIKRALYKEKPIAIMQRATQEGLEYKTTCSLGEINFIVPREDFGEGGFNDEEPAQLLIRWIKV